VVEISGEEKHAAEKVVNYSMVEKNVQRDCKIISGGD
jgi:hypothetical protein